MKNIIIKLEGILMQFDYAEAGHELACKAETYENASEYTENIKAMRRAIEAGYSVTVYATGTNNEACQQAKLDWCKEHLGLDEGHLLIKVGYLNYGRVFANWGCCRQNTRVFTTNSSQCSNFFKNDIGATIVERGNKLDFVEILAEYSRRRYGF